MNVRFVAPIVLVCAFAARAVSAASTAAAHFFAQLERAPLVVVATVVKRNVHDEPRFVEYTLSASEVLKGSRNETAPRVVEELIFSTDVPSLAEGDQKVFALEPQPLHSRLLTHLAPANYWRFTSKSGALRPVETATIARAYMNALAVPLPSESARRRVHVLANALADVHTGDDAVAALSAIDHLARKLSEKEIATISAVLSNAKVPLARRRALLGIIAERKLEALIPAVRPLLSDPAVSAFARQALVACGEVPDLAGLKQDLAASDPATRLAALQSAAALPLPERIGMLSSVARNDGDIDVRIAAIQLIGKSGPAGVEPLVALLSEADQRICYYATQALAEIGTADAVNALIAQLDPRAHYEAQTAAVFALRRVGTREAMEALARAKENPPNERLPRVIDFATGKLDEHH